VAKFRRFFIAIAATAFASAAAFAQSTIDDQIGALVDAWLNDYGGDFSPVVQEYGAQCITPNVVALPESAKQTIVGAGGMEDGLTALETADPDTLTAFLPTLQQCVDTMYVGEQIWAWVVDYYPLVGDDDHAVKATCLMNAVQPLPSEAKQIIFAGDDFQAGAQTLMLERPDLAVNLDGVLTACL
jgi:hypothetical protein